VKYAVSKKKVLYLLEKLKSYSATMHTFKKMAERIDNELSASVYLNAT